MPGRIIERNRYYPRIVDFCDNSSCMSCISLSWISYPKIHLKKNYIKMLVWLKKFQAWELSSQNLGLSTGGGLSVTWLGSAQLSSCPPSYPVNRIEFPFLPDSISCTKSGFRPAKRKLLTLSAHSWYSQRLLLRAITATAPFPAHIGVIAIIQIM